MIDAIEEMIEEMREHAEQHGLLVRQLDLVRWADTLEELLEEYDDSDTL